MASSTSQVFQGFTPSSNNKSGLSHQSPHRHLSFQVPYSPKRADQYSTDRSQEARSWSIHPQERSSVAALKWQKFTASLYFTRITPSFKSPLLILGAAENHAIPTGLRKDFTGRIAGLPAPWIPDMSWQAPIPTRPRQENHRTPDSRLASWMCNYACCFATPYHCFREIHMLRIWIQTNFPLPNLLSC